MATLHANGNITAQCPDCGSLSNFEHRTNVHAESLNHVGTQAFSHVTYTLNQCTSCHRGGLGKIYTHGGEVRTGFLVEFFPFSVEKAIIPRSVPDTIVSEFREAERCVAFGALRAASAMFRSTLEKALKDSGYKTGDLASKINTAAEDGVITENRAQRAHDEVRVLGNDVLHDEWRPVTPDEIELTHHYTQRILEDLYDDRTSVEMRLRTKGRLPLSEENTPEE